MSTPLTPPHSDDPVVQAERRGYALGRIDAAAIVASELPEGGTVLRLMKAAREQAKSSPEGVNAVLSLYFLGEKL
jgi:hypothetical protein